jgi:hypothetical protein
VVGKNDIAALHVASAIVFATAHVSRQNKPDGREPKTPLECAEHLDPMTILLKYRLTAPPEPFDRPGHKPEQAFVFMNADHLRDDSLIEYEGPERLVRQIRERVMRSYGFRARLIEEYTSPQDLACLMQGRLLEPYSPELVAGSELFSERAG